MGTRSINFYTMVWKDTLLEQSDLPNNTTQGAQPVLKLSLDGMHGVLVLEGYFTAFCQVALAHGTHLC